MMRKILATCAALLLLTGCSAPVKYQASFFDVFDTPVTFTAYTGSQAEFDRYVDIVRDEMQRLHKLFDIYNDYEGINNLKTVNDAAGVEAVPVDPSLIELLEIARQAVDDTAGAVNCALGPVLRIWHDYRDASLADPAGAALPDMDILREAALETSMDDVVIDREAGTVLLEAPGMSLDVGAVAKGYAAQRAMELAKSAGMTSGLLNAGGNVCAVGRPLDGRDSWSVGVQNPDLGAGGSRELWDTVAAADCSVVTSGDYQRYYVVEGVSYHHIIDPWTLYPARQVRSVTVIHPDGAMADILSTAAFILPREEAEELVLHQGGEAMWIFENGETACTEGYAIRSENFAE